MLADKTKDTWDFCPEPFSDESFLSWFTRLAKENCSDVTLLYEKLQGPFTRSIRALNKKEVDKQLVNVESNSEQQKKLSKNLSQFVDPSRIYRPDRPFTFSTDMGNSWEYLSRPLPSPRYCPSCLQGDETPYFRERWIYRFVTYCDIHKRLLNDFCPHCFSPIKFWQTEWNQPITTCYNCKKDISQDVGITSRICASFQESFFEVLRDRIFKGKKIEPVHFFRQFWRVAISESQDPGIRTQEPLTAERTFIALNTAHKCIARDDKRFDNPYFCPHDGLGFANEIDLELHMSQIHNHTSKEDSTLLERYRLIKPFLEKGANTKREIKNLATDLYLPFYKVYRWIRIYQNEGIKGLIRKRRERGKRSRRFSNEVYQVVEDNVASFDRTTMTMKKCWEKIVQECKALGYESNQIPSKNAIQNRIQYAESHKTNKILEVPVDSTRSEYFVKSLQSTSFSIKYS